MARSPLVRIFTKAFAVLALGFVSLGGGPIGMEKPALARDEQPAPVPQELQHVDVTEHLDAPIPASAHFLDQDGKPVTIGDYFGKKPIVLILAYHRCPVLCSLIQHAAATSFKQLADEGGWVVGKQYDVVVLSIDPTDTPEVAKKKRDEIVAAYGRPESVTGFHYIVGEKAEIDRVANAVGFGYQFDERQNQYAHPAVIMLVKPGGEMARYLYGLAFEARDLKFGLLEASEGKSISTVDRVILYCYHYDPQAGKYVIVATRVMQIGAGLAAFAMFLFLAAMWRLEKRRSKKAASETGSDPTSADPKDSHSKSSSMHVTESP